LQTWDSWNQGRAVNLLDPVLTRVSSRSDEVIRYVHIGLLCVQENVEDRPTMDSVIMMLSSNSFILPVPSRPAYFIHSTHGARRIS